MHKYLSDSFNCSGYCKPAELFAWNLSIEAGKPEKVCRDDIKLEMNSIFAFPALIATIGAIASALAFTAQYLLWKSHKAD